MSWCLTVRPAAVHFRSVTLTLGLTGTCVGLREVVLLESVRSVFRLTTGRDLTLVCVTGRKKKSKERGKEEKEERDRK